MSIAVELRDVSRQFGDLRAVDGVSLAIEDGEFFSLLGPSGSGKTTCLRLIGGFELPTTGQIFLHGEDASDLPPYERDVNTVFRDHALFPHLSVLDNVAYGLRMKGVGRAARQREAAAALEQVALAGLGNRHPGQLSQAQRVRVALARALVNRPRVLLLDEPLGVLDLKLREQVRVELKGLQRRLGITFIHATHDPGEALSMSDRVAVLSGGRVEQVDRPRELYVRPRTAFVAGFVGTANVLTGELARRITGSDRPVSIRPERVTFGAPGHGQLGIAGSVIDVQFHGATSRFEIEAAGLRLSVTIDHRDGDTDGGRPEPGDAVQLAWSTEAMVELGGGEPDDPAARPRSEPLAPAAATPTGRQVSTRTSTPSVTIPTASVTVPTASVTVPTEAAVAQAAATSDATPTPSSDAAVTADATPTPSNGVAEAPEQPGATKALSGVSSTETAATEAAATEAAATEAAATEAATTEAAATEAAATEAAAAEAAAATTATGAAAAEAAATEAAATGAAAATTATETSATPSEAVEPPTETGPARISETPPDTARARSVDEVP